MAVIHQQPAPSPWRGACHHCGGQLMKVQRRPIAGGMVVWAAVSAALMVSGLAVISVLQTHGWPFGLILFAGGLWLGLHRFERWQCRRCRTLYRDVVGDDKLDDKTARASLL